MTRVPQPGDKAKITKLRKEIAADKGRMARARATREHLAQKIVDCENRIRWAQSDIVGLGGKIRS